MRLRREHDGSVAAHEYRSNTGDEPEQRRLVRDDDSDDARRLRQREVEVRPGDGIRRAEHLRELVRPARVPDDPVDRTLNLLAAAAELRELGCARLEHLPEPVEHLPTVVRGHPGPLGERAARRTHGVADVLARGPRDVLPFRFVRATRLAAREGTADEELVRLLDGEPAQSSNLKYGSSPCRPPSRPKPDSR